MKRKGIVTPDHEDKSAAAPWDRPVLRKLISAARRNCGCCKAEALQKAGGDKDEFSMHELATEEAVTAALGRKRRQCWKGNGWKYTANDSYMGIDACEGKLDVKEYGTIDFQSVAFLCRTFTTSPSF